MVEKTTSDDGDGPVIEIATDEHGLVACGCGSPKLVWQAPRDRHAREADHSIEEAREIGGKLPWERHSPEEESMQRLFDGEKGPGSWNEWTERERAKAERNGLRAVCGNCYASLSPTMATEELISNVEGEK